MKIIVLKPCVINGKPHNPSDEEVTVLKKDGDILVSLGKVKDATPKEEAISLNLEVDVAAFEDVKNEIADLTKSVGELTTENISKNGYIKQLNEQIESYKELREQDTKTLVNCKKEAQTELSRLTKEVTAKNKAIKELQAQNTSSDEKVKVLESQLVSKDEDIKKLKSEATAKNKTIKELQAHSNKAEEK